MKYIISGINGKVGTDLYKLLNYKNILYKYNKNTNIEVDCFIHLSADSNANFKDYYSIVNSNINNLIDVVDYCKKNKIKNLIFFSAVGILGDKNKLNIDEDDISYNSIGLYNTSKLMGENILKESSINILILRLPTIISTKQDSGIIYRLTEKLKNNEDVYITNYNKRFNNFVSVEDISQFIQQYKFKTKYEVIYLAKKQTKTLLQIVKYLKKKINSKSEIYKDDKIQRFFNLSINKALKHGYKPEKIKKH